MNTRHISQGSILALLAAALLLGGGCATPAARIRSNQELFNSFPPETQTKIREGKIETGYTEDMVYIALGRPARVYSRTKAVGDSGETQTTEIWSYTRENWSVESLPHSSSHWRRGRAGCFYYDPGWDWVYVEERVEYEHLRVEFADKRVVAIDTLQE